MAWMTLCAISGFTELDGEVPLTEQELLDDSYHAASSTIIQVILLDSTIRNAISRASYEQKQNSVETLGPICAMLQFLIEKSKMNRFEGEGEECHHWIGAQLSQ